MERMASGNSLPTIIHDYSDVASEIEAALSPKEISSRMDVNCATVDDYRKNGTLIALPKGNNEFVYPAWQLHESGKPIPEIRIILDALHPIAKTPVEKMIQLLAKPVFFDCKSIKDFIEAGDMKMAVEAAEIRVEP